MVVALFGKTNRFWNQGIIWIAVLRSNKIFLSVCFINWFSPETSLRISLAFADGGLEYDINAFDQAREYLHVEFEYSPVIREQRSLVSYCLSDEDWMNFDEFITANAGLWDKKFLQGMSSATVSADLCLGN